MVLRAIVAGVVAVAMVDCGRASPSPPTEADEFRVVVTTSILADVVRQIVGDGGRVDPLLKVGTDPHAFQHSAAEIRQLEKADIVVANGLGLEASLLDALAAAEQRGTNVIRVAEMVDPLPHPPTPHRPVDDHETAHASEETTHGAEHGSVAPEGRGQLDPHFWQDPLRMRQAVKVIADNVAIAAPTAGPTISAKADAYGKALDGLHAELEQTLAVIPPANRKLVTNHETLGYFAARYGFEIIGTVVPGGGTLAETSSQQLAAIADTMRRAGVGAIFAETISSPRLAEALSQELGGQVEVVDLYTDSLGPEGSDADSYLDMMRTNARRIADALRP